MHSKNKQPIFVKEINRIMETEEYLDYLRKKKDYSEEQLEAVKAFRENPQVEKVPWEQYRHFIDNNLLVRTRRIKGIRSIFYFEDKLWYLNNYYKRYEYLATFKTEE